MKKVYVKLKARCFVDKEIKEAGEIVEIDEAIAKSFGEIVKVKSPDEKPEKK